MVFANSCERLFSQQCWLVLITGPNRSKRAFDVPLNAEAAQRGGREGRKFFTDDPEPVTNEGAAIGNEGTLEHPAKSAEPAASYLLTVFTGVRVQGTSGPSQC